MLRPAAPAALLFLAVSLTGAVPGRAAAQAEPGRGARAARQFTIQPGSEPVTVREAISQQARDVRSEFRRVLERYPPVLGKMLKLDPGLMNNAAYLAPYPAIAVFLQQHPEIPRDPGYYLDFVSTGEDYYNNPSYQQERWRRDVFSFVVGFTIVGGIALTLAWIVRYTIEHRRWLRATKIQSDMQNKLLERMSSNNELLAYVQSPAGQTLLQGVPVSIDPVPARAGNVPFNRILLSVQVGFVLAAAGAGLLVVRNSLGMDFQGVALVIGTIGVSLGVGFGLAAGASYFLSQKFGLLDANPEKMRPSGGA
jgi:hypothetical protein